MEYVYLVMDSPKVDSFESSTFRSANPMLVWFVSVALKCQNSARKSIDRPGTPRSTTAATSTRSASNLTSSTMKLSGTAISHATCLRTWLLTLPRNVPPVIP
jgi:hypothetical protein